MPGRVTGGHLSPLQKCHVHVEFYNVSSMQHCLNLGPSLVPSVCCKEHMDHLPASCDLLHLCRVVSFGQHVLMFGGAGEGKPVPRHNDLHALDLTNRERPEWRELTSLICCTTSTMPAGEDTSGSHLPSCQAKTVNNTTPSSGHLKRALTELPWILMGTCVQKQESWNGVSVQCEQRMGWLLSRTSSTSWAGTGRAGTMLVMRGS